MPSDNLITVLFLIATSIGVAGTGMGAADRRHPILIWTPFIFAGICVSRLRVTLV